jgi:hypothetical protein
MDFDDDDLGERILEEEIESLEGNIILLKKLVTTQEVENARLKERFKVLQGAVYIDIRDREYIQLDTTTKNAALWGDKQ